MPDDIYFDYNPWWEGAFQLENVVERPGVLDKMGYRTPDKEQRM